jgi:Kef-type K+ transport system membrane component KefB
METDGVAISLITLGVLFLAALGADVLGRRTRLPRVTLLLLLGVAVGPLGFDLLPEPSRAWFPFVSHIALVMVAFLLGAELTGATLRKHGRAVLVVSFLVVAATALAVGVGLQALGWSAAVALPLAAVATATDPAAVSDVVHESRAEGPFTKILLGVVAVDDAWGIAAMSLALVTLIGLTNPESAGSVVLEGVRELGGALLVGAALGVPMAWLTGRVQAGEPTQAEALGGVLLCGGVAMWLEVSFLLAPMTMGVVVANLARHHRRAFRAIEGIEWPFMIVFFVFSGASLAPGEVGAAAPLALAFVALRLVGRLAGGWVGSALAGRAADAPTVGLALTPQAGVAIGLALVSSQRLPDVGPMILSATVTATVAFELVGPVLTRVALVHAGETKSG